MAEGSESRKRWTLHRQHHLDAGRVGYETAGDECVCGVTTEPVPADDGSMGWLLVHHSLDGREASE